MILYILCDLYFGAIERSCHTFFLTTFVCARKLYPIFIIYLCMKCSTAVHPVYDRITSSIDRISRSSQLRFTATSASAALCINRSTRS